MKRIVLSGLLICTTIFFLAFLGPQQTAWPVPEKFLKMKNPVKADAASITNGKELYMEHCQSCHGEKGRGDGPIAKQTGTDCGNFTTAAFKKQADGAIFYKTLEGRNVMPSFKKKFPDQNEVWAMINYIRTLKK